MVRTTHLREWNRFYFYRTRIYVHLLILCFLHFIQISNVSSADKNMVLCLLPVTFKNTVCLLNIYRRGFLKRNKKKISCTEFYTKHRHWYLTFKRSVVTSIRNTDLQIGMHTSTVSYWLRGILDDYTGLTKQWFWTVILI